MILCGRLIQTTVLDVQRTDWVTVSAGRTSWAALKSTVMSTASSSFPAACTVEYEEAHQPCLTALCLLSGEGLVPEPEDEVEAGEGRPAGGGGTRERAGECEKRDVTSLWDFRDSGTEALCQLAAAGDWRGQPWQQPQLRESSPMTFHGVTGLDRNEETLVRH